MYHIVHFFTGVNFVLYIAISHSMREMYARFISDMSNQLKTKKKVRDKILTTLSSSSVSKAFATKKNVNGLQVNSALSVIYSSRQHDSSMKHNAFLVRLSIISSDDSFNWKIYQK